MISRRSLLGVLAVSALALVGCSPSKPQQDPAEAERDRKEFLSAVNDGDADVVDRLLAAKPHLVNVKDDSGKTPLTIANEHSNTELADVIKKHGGHE